MADGFYVSTTSWTGGVFRCHDRDPITLPAGIRVAMASDEGGILMSKYDPIDDCRFARVRDAEMAIAALRREGLNTPDALVDAGWERVKRVMIESLQW